MLRAFALLLGTAAIVAAVGLPSTAADHNVAPEGFVALFNGKDLTGWKVPDGDNGHWKVVDGVIDYDAKSESKDKDKSLATAKSFEDYVLRCEWKLKLDPAYKNQVPVILPSGDSLTVDGKEVRVEIDDVDSGIYMRGSPKAQVNIWMWPVGSGEVYGYRNDKTQPPEVRAGVTPKKRLDKVRGEWNTFEITMKGDKLSVKLNGADAIADAQLPGVPKSGPIVLQHHGSWNAKTNQWTSPPSLIQFRNIYVKELK